MTRHHSLKRELFSSFSGPATRAGPSRTRAPYGAMYDFGQLLLGSVDLEEVLRGIAEGLCHFSRCDRSVIVDYVPETEILRGLAGHGVDPQYVAGIQTYVRETPMAQAVIRAGRPLFVHEPTPANSVPQPYLDLFGVGGTLGVAPLISDRLGLLGMAFVDRKGESFRFDDEELAAFEAFCSLAALAFQNAILVERSQQLAAMLERSRIAADLHDGVSQLLFSVGLQLQEVLEAGSLPEASAAQLTRAHDAVQEGSRQLRRGLFELANQPGASADTTMGCLEQVLEDFTQRTGLSGDADVIGGGTDLLDERRQLAVRTAVEALRNVEWHAEGTEVLIRVRRGNSWWMVDIEDDGTGDVFATRRHLDQPTDHFGLYSLAREAAQLGGRLWIVEAPRLGGLCVSLAVPVDSDPKAR